MTKRQFTILFTAVLICLSLSLIQKQAFAHCQIPCGIYDDYAKVHEIMVDAVAVDRSMKGMIELTEKADTQSQNQMIRWVANKDKHAQHIISTISDYFLTQRVTPDQKDYTERLTKHHAVIIAAMKAKQNSDLTHAAALIESIEILFPYYPEHSE